MMGQSLRRGKADKTRQCISSVEGRPGARVKRERGGSEEIQLKVTSTSWCAPRCVGGTVLHLDVQSRDSRYQRKSSTLDLSNRAAVFVPKRRPPREARLDASYSRGWLDVSGSICMTVESILRLSKAALLTLRAA